jgi:hypothetical protein
MALVHDLAQLVDREVDHFSMLQSAAHNGGFEKPSKRPNEAAPIIGKIPLKSSYWSRHAT